MISYHSVRDAIAAQIIHAAWIRTHEKFSDVSSKALDIKASINKLIRNYPLLIPEIKLMRIKLAFNPLPFQN